MTRGVAGITGFAAKAMMSVGNGGSGEQATVPEKRLRMWANRTQGQRPKEYDGEDLEEEAAEWRCLSFLERRAGWAVLSEEAEADEDEDDLWY